MRYLVKKDGLRARAHRHYIPGGGVWHTPEERALRFTG